MSDERLRQLERHAACGSVEDRARLLRERVRRGDLAQDRLDLAAYCGDEAARAVIGDRAMPSRWADVHPANTWRGLDSLTLERWAKGLARWEGAPIRAAIAAARVAFPVWSAALPPGERVFNPDGAVGDPVYLPRDPSALRAIEAAEAHLACPCEEHLESWSAFTLRESARHLPPWCLVPEHTWSAPGWTWAHFVLCAAISAGESTVRAAICAALIRWALA